MRSSVRSAVPSSGAPVTKRAAERETGGSVAGMGGSETPEHIDMRPSPTLRPNRAYSGFEHLGGFLEAGTELTRGFSYDVGNVSPPSFDCLPALHEKLVSLVNRRNS